MLPETAAFFRPFAANVFWVEPVQSDNTGEILSIANYFCRSARMRIDHHFAGTARNADKRGYDLVQDLLAGKHEMLRQDMV